MTSLERAARSHPLGLEIVSYFGIVGARARGGRCYPRGMSANLQHAFTRLSDLDEPWSLPRQGPRLRAVRTAGERVRDRFASGPRVVSVRTLPLLGAVYPTKY